MKQKIFWFDLAVCCLWALGVLGNRMLWFAHPMMWIVALFVVSRIVLSFALYMGEKKAWVSGVMIVLLTGLVACFGLKPVVGDLTSKLFPMLGLEFNDRCFTAFNIGLTVWLWITPLTVLVVNALRKGRLVDTLSWAEACGKLLWTDKKAKTYGSLLLVAVGTMYAGLAMDARLCLFACVVAPTFTLCVLNRYCGITNGRV